MKGKTKKLNNTIKYLLLAVSFLLTIVLTATLTLAWFYDTDWANKSVQMSGAVGIEMRDHTSKVTSGDKQLSFVITSDYAYPGQAIHVSASVFNNGGSSIVNHFNDKNIENPTDEDIANAGKNEDVGSPCYVRATFVVYTNIASDEDADEKEKLFNAQSIYEFLVGLVETQNNVVDPDYRWVYYRNPNAVKNLEGKYYFDGQQVYPDEGETVPDAIMDNGYLYLCYTDGLTLKPLNVGDTAAYIWNDTFIIPWQLTNASADKKIFIGITFQAIQTYIPVINATTGEISRLADNQLKPELCYYYDTSVQTVFNTSNFDKVNTVIDGFDYSDADLGFAKASIPLNPDQGTIKGEIAD